MNIAAKVRADKEKNPENFCQNSRCLWRTVTRDGIKPCPKHPVPEVSPFDEMAAYQPGRGVHTAEQPGEEILTHAIRHIQRLHMNCRTWTLPAGDDAAIELIRDIRSTHRTGLPLVARSDWERG